MYHIAGCLHCLLLMFILAFQMRIRTLHVPSLSNYNYIQFTFTFQFLSTNILVDFLSFIYVHFVCMLQPTEPNNATETTRTTDLWKRRQQSATILNRLQILNREKGENRTEIPYVTMKELLFNKDYFKLNYLRSMVKQFISIMEYQQQQNLLGAKRGRKFKPESN